MAGKVDWCSILLLISVQIMSSTGQDWTKVPMWADFSLAGEQDWTNLDYRLGFAMDHYDIISLEKWLCKNKEECKGHTKSPTTELHFQELVSRMRELRPESNTKILFYWPTGWFQECYQAVADFKKMPELWLRDDEGYSVRPRWQPFPDFRIKESADYWIKVAVDQVKACQGKCQGVFLDEFNKDTMSCDPLSKTSWKTCGENKDSCCKFTPEERVTYQVARREAIRRLTNQIHEIDPSFVVIGNGIDNSQYYNGAGNLNLERYIDKIDGFCNEHFLSFEDVYTDAKKEPFVNPKGIENLILQRNILVEANKTLLVRGFPGPVHARNRSLGMSFYELPKHHWYKNPTSNRMVQQQLKDLLSFPLTVYLCALAGPNVYFTYSMWYNLLQNVPCPEDPDICQYPADFPELLDLNPGPPLTEPMWDGRVCSRDFQNIFVSVNIEDGKSGVVVHKPHGNNNNLG